MKKTLALLLAVLMMVSVIPFAAAADHDHKDNNFNGVCDEAGCTEATTEHDHVDANSNGTCDYPGCKETVQPEEKPEEKPEEPTHTHKDNNGNGICDEAGCTEATTNHDHNDANDNGVCDYPGCKVEVLKPSKPDEDKPTTGYDYNSTYHWVEINGVKIPGTSAKHTFNYNTGKCKYCGYYNKKYDKDYDYGYGYGDYRVYLSDSGKGDTSVSTYYADAGDRVYIYVDPDYGYKLVDIEVETKSGREVSVSKSYNGTYSFKMPSSNVYVEVEYSGSKYDKDYSYGIYNDVDSDDWFYSAVKYVTNNEIMEGTSYTKFSPNANMTRAALAEALYAIADAKASGTENFSDVDRYDDFYEAVVWCAKKDIIEGWNGKFSPKGDITREDFAVMMYRFAKVERLSTKASEDLDQFTDADDVSDYAVEALEWAVAEGLINGMGDGTVNPQGTTTRAQAAAILMRLCKNVK